MEVRRQLGESVQVFSLTIWAPLPPELFHQPLSRRRSSSESTKVWWAMTLSQRKHRYVAEVSLGTGDVKLSQCSAMGITV